jgi:hypothetical protein
MGNLSAIRQLNKSYLILLTCTVLFTSLKTLSTPHLLAQFSLAQVAHFLLAPKLQTAEVQPGAEPVCAPA